MKTRLLSFLLCLSVTGFAQTQVRTLDSSFTSTDGGATFSLNRIDERTYNAVCLNDTTVYRYFDAYSHTRLNTTRYIYTYNTDKFIQQTVFQVLDTVQNTFANNSRDIYTYDENNNLKTQTEDTWNGSQWVPALLYITDFNADGQVTLALQQRWNSDEQAYINYSQEIRTYNSNGKNTYLSSQFWDNVNRQWDGVYDEIYVYDASNFLVSDTFKNPYYADTLDLIAYTDYFNNSSGRPDSSFSTFVINQTYRLLVYTYEDNQAAPAQLYSYDYNLNRELTGITRTTNSSDSANGVLTRKTTTELAKSYSDPFVTQYRSSFTYIYSPNNVQTSFEFATTYYINGTAIYDYVFKDNFYYETCGSVFPVTLLSFTADRKDNNAILQWKTANETNTTSFAIQRSTDDIHFTTIGTVKAARNSSGERSYAYTDGNITNLGVSKVYYRLAQQDVDGAIHNSRIAQVDIANGKLSITLSPNPVRNSINIYSPVALQNAVVRIANMSGTVVYTSRSNLATGGKLTIDASSFARGVYLVTVQTGSGIQVSKLVKEGYR